MNSFFAVSIGCYLIAAATYVRDGATWWYALFALAGLVMAMLGGYASIQ